MKRDLIKTIYTLIFAILILTGCNDSKVDELLDKAESFVAEHSDSTAMLLATLNDKELPTHSTRMRYALLNSLVLDAHNNALYNDTLTNEIVEYYERQGDKKRLFLALYAQGRMWQLAGHSQKAAIALTKAWEIRESIEEPAFMGMFYTALATLYKDSYDFDRALEHFRLAHLHYRLAGAIYREHNALVDIARVLIEKKQYSEAEQCLLDELKWGYDKRDKQICQSCVENLLQLYDRTKYMQRANWLLDSDYFTLCDTTMVIDRALAYIHAVDDEDTKSHHYIQRAWERSTTANDTLMNLMCMYDISKLRENHSEALEILENIHYIHDAMMRSALQQPMLSAQRDFYRSQAELNSYMLRNTKRLAIAAIVIALLVLCIIVLVLRNRIAAKNGEVERYMELADDISVKLENRNAHIEMMDKQVRELFKKQFELLDELSGTYYETRDIKKDKDAIYRQVRENIESLMKEKKSVERLEDIVNSYRGDIMKKIRREIPQLGENELRFLVFIYAGFSSKAISIFMQESVGNVYTKKSRIKGIISRADTPSKEAFIAAMS